LRASGVEPADADYELVAVGPLHAELERSAEHWAIRDRFAAIETAVARELGRRGYQVVGHHGSRMALDETILADVLAALDDHFPRKRGRVP
jgi:hypothetical protein